MHTKVRIGMGTSAVLVASLIGAGSIAHISKAYAAEIQPTVTVSATESQQTAGLTKLEINGSDVLSAGVTNYFVTVDSTQKPISILLDSSNKEAVITVNGTVYNTQDETPQSFTIPSSNTFSITVNNKDGTTVTYNVMIVTDRNVTDNNNFFLQNIKLSQGNLNPEFNFLTTQYNVKLPNNINSITVTPDAFVSTTKISLTASDSKGNAIPLTGNTDTMPLAPGETTVVKITVTAANGDLKIYTINVENPPAESGSGTTGGSTPGGSGSGTTGGSTPGGSGSGTMGGNTPGGSGSGTTGGSTPGGSGSGTTGGSTPAGSGSGTHGGSTPAGPGSGTHGGSTPGGPGSGTHGGSTPGGSKGGTHGGSAPGGSKGGTHGGSSLAGSKKGTHGVSVGGTKTGTAKGSKTGTTHSGTNGTKTGSSAGKGSYSGSGQLGGASSPKPSTAVLASLSVSSGTWNKAFDPNTFTYHFAVASNVASVTIDPGTKYSDATFSINGGNENVVQLDGIKTIVPVVVTRGAEHKTYVLVFEKPVPAVTAAPDTPVDTASAANVASSANNNSGMDSFSNDSANWSGTDNTSSQGFWSRLLNSIKAFFSKIL